MTTPPRTPLWRFFPALALLAAGPPASGQDLTPAPDPAFSPAAGLTAPDDGGCGCACEPEPCVQPLYSFGADPLDLSVSVAVADPRDASRAHRLTFDLAPAGFTLEEEMCVEDDAGRPMSLVIDEDEEEEAVEVDCAGVRGKTWEWNHGLPQKQAPKLTEILNRCKGADDKPMIDINDPKWGWYMPRDCHRFRNGTGIHTNGPDGDLVNWQQVWQKWAEKWDEEHGGTGCPTEAELKDAYDAFRNDEPGKARPPINPDEDFDTSGGKNCWRKGRFGKCFGQGCKAEVSHPDWLDIDREDRPDKVLEDCCGGTTEPQPID